MQQPHILDSSLPLAPPPKPPKQRTEIKVAPDVLKRYVGAYDLPGPNATITRSARGLSGRIDGGRTARLYAETERTFFLKVVDAQVSFQVDARGRVTGLVLHQDGQRIRAKKIR